MKHLLYIRHGVCIVAITLAWWQWSKLNVPSICARIQRSLLWEDCGLTLGQEKLHPSELTDWSIASSDSWTVFSLLDFYSVWIPFLFYLIYPKTLVILPWELSNVPGLCRLPSDSLSLWYSCVLSTLNVWAQGTACSFMKILSMIFD